MKNDPVRFYSCFLAAFSRPVWKAVKASVPGIVFLSLVLAGRAAPVDAGAGDAQENAQGSAEVLGVIRGPAPKELSAKITAVAQRIAPGPQASSLTAMLGGMLGDPMFDGFAPGENAGAVLVARGMDIQAVWVMKLLDSSPLRQSLPAWDLQLKESGGWTFGWAADASATLVDGHEEELIELMRGERRYDVELALKGATVARKLREVLRVMPGDNGVEQLFLQPMLQALSTEIDAVEDLRIGVDLSPETLREALYIQAAPGSELAAFLNQKRSADFGFARFLPADGAIRFLGGMDVAVTRRYIDHLVAAMPEAIKGKAPEIWTGFQSLSRRWLDTTDGRSAGVLSIEDFQVKMSSLAPSSLTNEELIGFLQETVELMRELQKDLGEAEAMLPKYTLLLNQLDAGGTPVHAMRMEMPVAGAADAPTAEGEDKNEDQAPAPELLRTQQQDMYYAVVGGYLANAASVNDITRIIEAVKLDQPVENNLAARLQLSENDLVKAEIDPVGYLGGFIDAVPIPGVAEVLAKLKDRRLAPVKANISMTGGAAEAGLAVPTETVAALYQAVMAFAAEQQQQMLNGPGSSPGTAR